MKALSFFVSFLAVTMMSLSAVAGDFAAVVGLRNNSADADAVGYSIGSTSGYGIGVLGLFDMTEQFQVRTGFLYNEKKYSLKDDASAVTSADLKMAYVDIPVTAVYRFADYAGAFAGPVLNLLASKECTATGGCGSIQSPEGLNIGLQFGATFKFAPQMGGEVYYETIPSTFWKGLAKNSRTVGFNLLFTFE